MNSLFEDRHQSIMKILDRKAEKEDIVKLQEQFEKDLKGLDYIINNLFPDPSDLKAKLDFLESEVQLYLIIFYRSMGYTTRPLTLWRQIPTALLNNKQ